MKKSTAWLLLTIYLSASCAGLMPMAWDAIAHVLWHKAHMEHVHHGDEDHEHVTAEIAQALDADHHQPGTFSEINDAKISLSAHYFRLSFLKPFVTLAGAYVAFPPLRFRLPTGAENSIFLPPRLA